MKIGILTYHRARNYGAFLQAYAFCKKLNEHNFIQAEIIDYQMEKEVNHYSNKLSKRTILNIVKFIHDAYNVRKQSNLFEKDIEQFLCLSAERLVSDSIKEFQIFLQRKDYDAIIVGSDEIWKTDGFRGFPTPYWLIGEFRFKKYAYAVSGRNSYDFLSQEKKIILNQAISEFEYIGVRDSITKKEVEKYRVSNQIIKLCCDPTFLINFDVDKKRGYAILQKKFGVDLNKKVIGIMTENHKISKQFLKKIDKKEYEIISLYEWHFGCIDGSLLSPFEWLEVLNALDLIFTSFFHTVCFAAKFAIPMIAFATPGKASKVEEVIIQTNRKQDYYSDILQVIHSKDMNNIIREKIVQEVTRYLPNEDILGGYNELIKILSSV